jgi:hypothetical protein
MGGAEGAFERDGDMWVCICDMRADARGVDRSSGGEAKGGRELESQAAFEFGGTENGILGAAFKCDERATIQVAGLGEKVEVGAGAPGPQAPCEAGAFIGYFPRGTDG